MARAVTMNVAARVTRISVLPGAAPQLLVECVLEDSSSGMVLQTVRTENLTDQLTDPQKAMLSNLVARVEAWADAKLASLPSSP